MPEQSARSRLIANLLLLIGSLVFSALLLAMAEGGLRLAGIGADQKTSRLKYQQLNFPILHPTQRPDGAAALQTVDSRLPYQSILREKPPGALRVFTFGGSATAGLGYSPNVTFARDLERMLEVAYPERDIEVVNLGVVALASAQVKLMVAEACQHYDADLLVVYSGNNEFLEVHAAKFAEASATVGSRIRDNLMRTNLYRLVNTIIRGKPRGEKLKEEEFSTEDLRLTQNEIIQQVEMSAEEISGVIDRYQRNLEEMVEAAAATETPIVLATVASNWRWRGRKDLPEGWLQEFLGEPDRELTPELYREALPLLSAQLEKAAPAKRYDWLYKRALVEEALGDLAAARSDYRATMNEDPHLRRALDAMAERVRKVAAERKVGLVDTINEFSGAVQDGIVGFGEFYDYVHMTPRGTQLMAAAIFRAMRELGLVSPTPNFDEAKFARERLDALSALQDDALDVREWLGFGFDRERIGDRDLWKYEHMVKDLDKRLQEDPEDVRALVYRANASYFKTNGAAKAARQYRTALALRDDPTIRSNLQRLLAERVP